MQQTRLHISLFAALGIALVALFLVDLSFGAISIPLGDVFKTLTGGAPAKTSWEYIILDYRLPKAITALLAGIGLSIGGLLMQTLFRNPLAGPDVLGLSSGASLGVAFVILGSALLPAALGVFFTSAYGVVIAATAGSFLVLLAVLAVAQRLRDTMAILIVGLMFSSFTGAIVGVLTYFSSAEKLQKYTFWALGSLGNLPWDNIIILGLVLLIGLSLAILCIKPLDALLLGERYAKSLGVNLNRTRIVLILATSLLTGCVTAFVGPIAFVGLVVPHMAKLLFKTGSHKILFTGTLLIGAALMLLCDTFTQLPGSAFVLPVNAITSLIGAPVVISLLISKKKGIFS
ncbi:iron ABC transporter [Flavobacterium akiainvivens]|uniref:Iron ABC transporter n=1 Tax=Flavobacterium akiainvivens TaxID=1202724 RepID=A0A0M8M9C7_9FLAO|nr:iron ABC transporter permease [Flavobacterium akiainvivens]KOS06243.1 iron ABC transporter [Flavobacterium akiainvivens]SFQ18095.1 iron complex transport system permease protein [Flavobacterium akiainvivens]